MNVIAQSLRPVHSPYAGPNSLGPSGDDEISHAYGAYAGVRGPWGLEGYLDVEMIRGSGVNHATGLAGVTNGDVVRQGSVDLGNGPYVARAFVRRVFGASADRDTLAAAPDQIPSIVARRRLEVDAGKLAASDVFDLNRYANSTRWQFMNWGLFQNSGWDYPADTRGYTNGVAVSWIAPRFAARIGSFQMPTAANGNHFDPDLRDARGDVAEVTVTMPVTETIVRPLVFMNHARMGDYAEALAVARRTGGVPNIVATDARGRRKYGYGLNVEQPLADSGETGAFARLGWNDGATESFVFTEVDRHASAGLQVDGVHWGRAADRVGAALLVHGLADAHRDYLAGGGSGFLLGDGALTYGREQIIEAYYRAAVGDFTQLSADVQRIRNPGYNRDRGPATVLGLRVNVRY